MSLGLGPSSVVAVETHLSFPPPSCPSGHGQLANVTLARYLLQSSLKLRAFSQFTEFTVVHFTSPPFDDATRLIIPQEDDPLSVLTPSVAAGVMSRGEERGSTSKNRRRRPDSYACTCLRSGRLHVKLRPWPAFNDYGKPGQGRTCPHLDSVALFI